MKDYSYIIKVSDLLKTPWSKDSIIFENKFSKKISNLWENWIKWNISLQSLDNKNLLIKLYDIYTYLYENCEMCWCEYKRNIKIDEYEWKFWFDENKVDEIFPIDLKNENIDIEELIIQSIILENPVIKKCDNCNILENPKNIENDTILKNEIIQNKIKWINK